MAVVLSSTTATASTHHDDEPGTPTPQASGWFAQLRGDGTASRTSSRPAIPVRAFPDDVRFLGPWFPRELDPEPALPGSLDPAPPAVPVPGAVDETAAPTPTPAPTPPSTPTPTPAPTPTSTTTPTPPPTPTPTPTTAPVPVPATPASKPGADNTGVPAGISLTVHEGDLTISTPGAVVEGLDIHGFVKVTAPDVVIRNSIIRGRDTTSAKGLLTATSDGASVTIEDSELAPTTASPWIDGIRGWNITARRVNIHGVIDGFHLYGPNTTIEASWIHDHAHFQDDPQQGGSPSHDDSVQIQQGSNIRITGNTISGAYNTGIQFTQDQGKVSDVKISQNWLGGGGCTVNFAEKGLGPFTGIVISDNTFGRDTRVADCAIIAPATTKLSTARNTFVDGVVAAVRDGG